MHDRDLALEILDQLHEAAATIQKRSEPFSSAEEFTGSEAGMVTFDSICMLLIAIGEGLKNLDKVTRGTLLPHYSHIDWKSAKGMRDIISHHYFKVDAEVIFHVCKNHIQPMAEAFANMIEELS